MDIISCKRDVPVKYEADIVVIGGGMAGVSAACSAAKSGARVILVERFATLGGNATTGGVAAFCGETKGQGEVFDSIISELQRWDAIEPYRPHDKWGARVFDHHILAVVLQELVLSRGIELMLHTRFIDVVKEDDSISHCLIYGQSGIEAVKAKMFIDCSGEAELVRSAGLEVVKGREGDNVQLPMSMMGFVRHCEVSPQMPQDMFERIESKDELPMTSIWPNGPMSNAIKIKIPKFDSTDTAAFTQAEIYARRRFMQVLDYYQRCEGKAWRYDGCSPRIGIREGCRIKGEYTLTVDDLRAARIFDDAIAVGTFYLDAHKPDDDKRTYVLSHEEMEVPAYQIPLRVLVPKKGGNILVAGRCLSADQLALSSARTMTTCSMMGQAAGIAAAMCCHEDCLPRDLDSSRVRKNVEERSAVLSLDFYE